MENGFKNFISLKSVMKLFKKSVDLIWDANTAEIVKKNSAHVDVGTTEGLVCSDQVANAPIGVSGNL
jgi:hypothetical protein